MTKYIWENATTRATNVSFYYTEMARNDPEKFYKENFPISLGFSSIGGALVFVVLYFLFKRMRKKSIES